MIIPTLRTVNNPVTGVFGTGNVQWFIASGTWTVPQGIAACRVRLWSGGSCPYSSGGGCGGGFAMKSIYDLSGVSSVTVTVGTGGTSSSSAGGSSSFGSYVSVTGASSYNSPGAGSGGDVNFTGGTGGSGAYAGGGAAGLFGNGGNALASTYGANGCAGSGGYYQYNGGAGVFGAGAIYNANGPIPAQIGVFSSVPSIDFIATGGGGNYYAPPSNGGGGGAYSSSPVAPFNGAFPAGGAGYYGTQAGNGLVIVEW